jgi:hypothetical protein
MKNKGTTRSAKVFAAGCRIANPFLLCRVTAVYARRLQKPRVQFAESINESLRLISDLKSAGLDATNLPIPPAFPEEVMVADLVGAAATL